MISKFALQQVLEEQHKIRIPEDFVEREAYQKLQTLCDNPEIIVITGLRRVGKSTLLQQLRQRSSQSDCYINFDDDRLMNFTLEDFQMLLELFIELYGIQKTFYFDEIQNITGWERFVRRLYEQGNKIFITGSNATLFSQELGTRLTGRYIQLELYPFSFSESLHHEFPDSSLGHFVTTEQRGLTAKAFANYQQKGGIPSYVRSGETECLHFLYESVLYRDIISRYKLPNDRPIKELVYYFASNVGNEFSYSSLAKQLGIGSPTTVSDYCHYLSMSYLCFTVTRFSYSLSKQQLHSKKCYFIDHTMARVLGFRFSEDKRRLLKNLVYIELRRRQGEIYFHKEQRECDFLVRKQGAICQALQVCLEMTDPFTRKREMEGLLEAMHAYQLTEGTIITESEEETILVELAGKQATIHVLPAWKWATTACL